MRHLTPTLSTTTKIAKMNWKNSDNNHFYQVIKANGLKIFAEKAGLSTGKDIEKIKPYWLSAKSILEAGAGYGRVIEYLLKNNFTGKITAIERCQALSKELKKKFSMQKNVTLLEGDILYTNTLDNKFDLIFLLWHGIADFSQKEQPALFCKLRKFLTCNGKLIIDTIPDKITPLDTINCGNQNYLIVEKESMIHIYLPTSEEIEKYAKMAEFEKIEKVCYQTDNQRQRWLYIMS